MSFIGRKPLIVNSNIILEGYNIQKEEKNLKNINFQLWKIKKDSTQQNWTLFITKNEIKKEILIDKNFTLILQKTGSNSTLIYLKPLKTVSKDIKQIWGSKRAELKNILESITQKHEITLILRGIGYKATQENNQLKLRLGFSHQIVIEQPSKIEVEINNSGQEITLRSLNKRDLGQFASKIQQIKPPEPYKLKGIIIKGKEHLLIKKESKRRSNL